MYDKQDMNFRSYKGYSILRTDPFGLWVIKDESGKLLTDEKYTMVTMAKAVIDLQPPKTEKKRKD